MSGDIAIEIMSAWKKSLGSIPTEREHTKDNLQKTQLAE